MGDLVRALIMALSVVGAAAGARAAPTCSDAEGRTVRCEAPSAMPVGWKPGPEAMALRRAALPPGPTPAEVFGLACFLGGLLALFALLPDFEDGDGGGWDSGDEGDA